MKKTCIILMAGVLFIACDKKSGEGGGEAAASSSSLKLEKIGLQADAPEGSKVSDAMLGDGVMIQGPNLVVDIKEASEAQPATLEAAKEDAAMYKPTNVKPEKLADGWAISYENKGSMGTNYFVQVRRTIGDKTFFCSTTASNPEQKANALAACKSLRK
jgi:hypothetical protein